MVSFRLVSAVILPTITAFVFAQPLSVVVNGKKIQISEDDIQRLASHDVALKEHDGSVLAYTGALVSDILAKAGVALGEHVRGKALATYVLVKASDGYEVVFGIGELEPTISGRNIVLAYKANGQPLIPSAGPLRIVVEGDKKQARSIRMVTELDVVSLRK